MYGHHFLRRSPWLTASIALTMLLLLVLPGTVLAQSQSGGGSYQKINLVSDLPGVAKFTDPNLVNPWGISFSSSSPFWISDNVTSVSTLYDGHGKAIPLVVTIPPPAGGTVALPTGTVFNNFPNAFVVSANGMSGQAFFLFDTLSGTISGWNPNVDGTHAILAVDNSKAGAVYTGLTIGSNHGHPLLFAANFAAGTIDAFDAKFAPAKLQGSFHDPGIPKGYAPFNIQSVGNRLYVTYARQDRMAGQGRGFVDIFDTNGNLVKRLISHSALNLPWGVTLAPADFGQFSNDLLVGNFGNGWINAFDPHTGAFLGSLTDRHGNPFAINRLWALAFGNGGQAGKTNQLFFTAGIHNEQHGLFGFIEAV